MLIINKPMLQYRKTKSQPYDPQPEAKPLMLYKKAQDDAQKKHPKRYKNQKSKK